MASKPGNYLASDEYIQVMGGYLNSSLASLFTGDGKIVPLSVNDKGQILTSAGSTPLTVVAIQATASGDTQLIAAPGGTSKLRLLRVDASNSSATADVVVGLKSAALAGGGVFGKRYMPKAGGMATWVFPQGYLECGANQSVSVNLSATGQIELTAYYLTA